MANRRTAARMAPAADDARLDAPGGGAPDGREPGDGEVGDPGAAPGSGEVDGTGPEAGAPAGPAPARRRAGAARKPAARRRARKGRRRIVRWSAAREAAFLEMLGQTGNVAEAVRASRLSETNVYRRRAKSEEFREKWAVALREGFAKLEMLMLERALAGVERPVWHGGKQVGTVRDYDNATCLKLLAAHRGTVNGDRPIHAEPSEEAMRAAVAERLAEMNRNMGGAG